MWHRDAVDLKPETSHLKPCLRIVLSPCCTTSVGTVPDTQCERDVTKCERGHTTMNEPGHICNSAYLVL